MLNNYVIGIVGTWGDNLDVRIAGIYDNKKLAIKIGREILNEIIEEGEKVIVIQMEKNKKFNVINSFPWVNDFKYWDVRPNARI